MSLMPENPYLPDKGQQLAMLLMSLGGGISQAASNGQGGFAGVGQGLSTFAGAMGAARQQQEADALRRWQIGLQEREVLGREAERRQKADAANTVAGMIMPGGGGQPPVPGMNVPPSKPRMGPDTYETRTASLEGGGRNGGMIFNELGSGAYGPYQIMPATWADIRTNNPDLNLPADITAATREQHDAAHTRFKAGNAKALQTAGFEPTPQNLYLAHRFGAGGATSLLRSGDDKMLADVLPIEWQRQNPDMRGQTVGGFKRLAGERMQGVGVPYQANGETTSYSLAPTALPAFEGMPGQTAPNPRTLPAGQAPSFSAPVMPQPQMQAPQAAPQAAPSQAPPQAAPQADAPPMSPPQVPMPMLPAQIGNEIAAALKAGAITPEQALARKQQVINDLWSRNQTAATAAWQQQWDAYKFNRGQNAEETRFRRGLETEGEWVRGADGTERWQPKSARTPGQVRHEKPPAAGTEAGDIHILQSSDPSTQEYATAYDRVRTKLMDGPDGLKYAPDMSNYATPTFKRPGSATGGAPTAPGETSAPPGLVPVGAGRERKYTESQSKDYGFARRLQNALPQLEAIARGDDGKYSTARMPSSYERTKMTSPYYPDSLLTPEAKEFRRVTTDVVTAILRKESGGAITLPEFPMEYVKYIPQPGDSDKEIKAKLKAIRIIAKTYAEGSGRGLDTFGGVFDDPDTGDAAPGKAKAAPIRIDMSGKRQ